MINSIAALTPFDEKTGDLNVVIESPRGCSNKYTFDGNRGLFYLSGILTAGHFFPFDFGFIPGTLGGDGDPLDVLLVIDEPVFTGCLVPSRLIGVIKAEQTKNKTVRNDRLVAVPAKSLTHTDIRSLKDLNETLIDQMEHFFISYNEVKGKEFKPIGRLGPRKATQLVRDSIVKESNGK